MGFAPMPNRSKIEEVLPPLPPPDKWEERINRLTDWFNDQSPWLQALIKTITVVVSTVLIFAIGIFFIKVFGWWNFVVLPLALMYFVFYANAHDAKRAQQRRW